MRPIAAKVGPPLARGTRVRTARANSVRKSGEYLKLSICNSAVHAPIIVVGHGLLRRFSRRILFARAPPPFVFPVNIVVVEDHHFLRQLLRKTCEQEFGHRVVGATDVTIDALGLIVRRRPDLVLFDMELGQGQDSAEIAREIMAATPSIPFLAIARYVDDGLSKNCHFGVSSP